MNIGATVQTIFQYQESSCLSHCREQTLVQQATQEAHTDQTAAAGDVPEPVIEPPSAPALGPQPTATSPSGSVLAQSARGLLGPASPGQRPARRAVLVRGDWRRPSEASAPRSGFSSPPADLGKGEAGASSAARAGAGAASTPHAAARRPGERKRSDSRSALAGAPVPATALEGVPASVRPAALGFHGWRRRCS